MSNAILSSNANSSLINTLMGSESVRNTSVYSTEEITPPHASTYQKCETNSSGVAQGGRTQNFPIMKYGYLQQVLLCWSKDFTVAVAPGTSVECSPANDVIRCIDTVDLMSSGRVVSQMTGDDLFAAFSDLSESESIPIRATALGARSVSVPTGGTALTAATIKYCVPIVFPQFEEVNTQLNCQFLEGLTIRVKWGSITNHSATPTAASIQDDSMYLRLRYKAYAEEQVSEVLASNFDSPELAQLSARWYSEPPQTFTASGTTAKVTVQLKNTDCVQDFFTMCYLNDPATSYACAKIDNIQFVASGQTLVEMSQEELLYARLGEHGWSHSQDINAGGSAMNVAKVQNGLYAWGKLSNTLSLRELNNPQVIVNISGLVSGSQYSVRVCEKCTAIFSTTSATGKYNIALSN